ncbi:MAG: citrate synthase/methylcitrate synthase [Acidimicrobiales bacterium]|nr:citrate synthase/methylcitrate synthase [Acidimicrobiales bacterium]
MSITVEAGAKGAQPIDVPAGLRNVVAAETEVGNVLGLEGIYHYRQYDATELARRCDLETVWFLLDRGRLPSGPERDAFAAELAAARRLPDALLEPLTVIARAGGPLLSQLRTALSLAGAQLGVRPLLDLDPDERRGDLLALAALTPTLVGALHRLGRGEAPVEARDDLGHAAHYLWSALGRELPAAEGRAVEQYLIATIDHGFNASTFTGRVVASTGADAAAVLVAALAALSGPLHGGAPSRALEALEEIGAPERAADWVDAQLAAGGKIMGFGHAVYAAPDPRSALLGEIADRLGGELVGRAKGIEAALLAALAARRPGVALPTNVEFYAGVVMQRCGLPPELFTPTFAVSRVIGWAVHAVEQAASGKIIRPTARYVGPWPLEPVPA